MTVRIAPGDCLEVIPQLVAEGVVVDAIATDPPYHLLPTSKRFGPGQVAAQGGRDGSYKRLSGGFMHQVWDGGDIAFRPETWTVAASILRPGGFLLAFGGTRTYHRLVSAIEDAGFIIQDQIAWLFGSGFPKRRDMLKPAFEPVCVAYKPGGKRTLGVEECRIETNDALTAGACKLWSHYQTGKEPRKRDGEASANRRYTENGGTNFAATPGSRGGDAKGRWPANCVHDGSDEVMEAFATFDAPGQQGDLKGHTNNRLSPNGIFGAMRPAADHQARGDSGSPSRFFYCAKADGEDRFGSRHPTVKPVELMKWLVPLVTPKGGVVLDPFAGSGTTGVAAMATGRNAILIEREEAYVSDIRARMAHYEGEGRHSLVTKNRQRAETTGTLL